MSDARFGRCPFSPAPVLPFLLRPLDPGLFVREHWGKAPLLVKGDRSRFSHLFSSVSIESVRSRGAPRASITAAFPNGSNVKLDPADLDSAASAGATIQIKDFHTLDPAASALCASLKSEMTYAGDVTCEALFAVAGSRIPNHIDDESVFSLQIEGTRHWRMSSRPVIRWPRRTLETDENGTLLAGDGESWEYDCEKVEADEWMDLLAEPGDMLFHPSGVWHELKLVTAGASGRSVSLSIVFRNTPLSRLIEALVEEHFAPEPAWRNLPVVLRSESPDSLPPPVREYLRARCDELRRYAAALDPDGIEIDRCWKKLVAQYQGTGPVTSETAPLLPDDQLALSTHQPQGFAASRDGDSKNVFYIHAGTTEVCLDAPDLVLFARALVRQRTFAAASATAWAGAEMSWDQTRTLLEQLLAVGILERSERT
jgi:ribosomal protein L16 Arg81 hydroxylase